MHRSISNRVLLRSILAGAVVLAGSSACSRPDRADAGDNTNQPAAAATPADTQAAVTATADTPAAASPNDTVTPPPGRAHGTEGVSGYQPMARDTLQNDTSSQVGAREDTDTVAVGDTAQIGKPGERLEGTRASEQANEDTLTNQPDSARIRPPEDTGETSGAAVESSEMARDTSAAVAQGDTLVQTDTSQPAAPDTAGVSVAVDTGAPAQEPMADTTTHAVMDTTATTNRSAHAADSSAIQVSVDTTAADQETEVAVENRPAVDAAPADTAVVAPEDSTEVLGKVTPETGNAEIADGETQDAAVMAAAGVESTGNAVTGANAVAQMTRQGQNCSVVSGPEDVRWDMALSPATLNPCGTGTMTMPKVVTGR